MNHIPSTEQTSHFVYEMRSLLPYSNREKKKRVVSNVDQIFLPFICPSDFLSSPPSTVALVCDDVGGEVVGGEDSQLYKLNCLWWPSFLPSANVVALGGFLMVVGGELSESVSLSCEISLFGLGISRRIGSGEGLTATKGSSSSARESFAVFTGVSAGDSTIENREVICTSVLITKLLNK